MQCIWILFFSFFIISAHCFGVFFYHIRFRLNNFVLCAFVCYETDSIWQAIYSDSQIKHHNPLHFSARLLAPLVLTMQKKLKQCTMDVMRQANECDTQKKHMHKSMHRINCTQWIVEWKNFNHNFDIEQQYAAVFSLIFPLQFDFNIRMHIMWFVDIFFLCVPYTALTKTQPLLSICIARINNNISLCFCEDVFRVKRFFFVSFLSTLWVTANWFELLFIDFAKYST